MAVPLWWDVDGRDGEKATDNGMGRQNQTKPQRRGRRTGAGAAKWLWL